ncbi:MAG TPA: PIG-L deacetylase family protein [Actinomycetota bacterium]|nr:PIG-L deacetylase family protein [Actinomycetota bacterium]
MLAVCAHPDDESFGLGAVLDAFVRAGSKVSVLSLTRGEASRATERTAGELGEVRAGELASAAAALGLERARAMDYPDGRLAAAPLDELAREVRDAAATSGAELLVVFDEQGITGHPDHRHATSAAVRAGRAVGLPVLAWAIPDAVARTLNTEYGTSFVGTGPDDLFSIEVDRSRQWKAITRHQSQAEELPLVARRLELLGNHEHLRWLAPTEAEPADH